MATKLSYSYEDDERRPGAGARDIKWNSISLAGRQGLILLSSLLIARLIGPESYGVVAQASVYISFTTLVLDQGVSTALITRKSIRPDAAGAASTLNLLLALGLILVTVAVADPIASFFRMPELGWVLQILAVGLIFKALIIIPRMLLMRRGEFRSLANTEIASALAGSLAGISMAIVDGGVWAIVLQILVMDATAVAIAYFYARPPLINLRFRSLKEMLGFSTRVFVANMISYVSRNADSVLVGRFLGASQLAFYSLSYRVLLTPLQMVGLAVSRVLLPAVSRNRSNLSEVRRLTVKSVRGISLVTFPVMAFVSAASYDLVAVFLGAEWSQAAPVIAILAITGARQAVSTVNAPLLLGMDDSRSHLWFNICAAVVQVAGMIIGLQWGIVGVATGYTIAGFMLMPVVFWIQRRLTELSMGAQLRALLPALHSSAWASATAVGTSLLPVSEVLTLCASAILFFAVYAAVLRLFHEDSFRFMSTTVRDLVNSRGA